MLRIIRVSKTTIIDPNMEMFVTIESPFHASTNSMNSLFNHAVKQEQALKRDLAEFAKSPETTPLSLQGQISATLTTFNRTLDDYANAINNEIVPEKKERAEQRIEKFRSELQAAREEFASLKKRREEEIHQSDRQELFGRRHASAVGSNGVGTDTPENPYGHSANQYTNMSQGDGLLKEKDVLSRTGQQLDEFIERGRLVLNDLGDQREFLKNTQRSLYSVANTLGISNETIRLVERRAFQDKFIFYGGFLFMIVCFYYIIKWVG